MRFPEFDGEWVEKKLGEVGSVKMCRRIFNEETSPFGEVPFYKIGSFGKDADAYISKELYLDYKKRFSFPKKGDILISAAGTIGRTVVYNGEDSYYQDSNIVWIDNDKSFISNEFLSYILQIVKFNTEGGTIQRLYNNILKSTKFWSPNFHEQKQIFIFLSLIDERIQTQSKIIEELKSFKSAVSKKIFSQELRFKDENGHNYPDWEMKKLKDVFYSEKGKGISKNMVVENGKYECILYGELYTKYKEFIVNVISTTNVNNGLKSQIGDLLIPSSTTTTGVDLANVTAINKENVLLGGDITVLRAKKKINNVFYAYYLSNYKKEEIANYAQGSTIIHLYYNHIKDMCIDIPSLDEQDRIAKFLSFQDEKIETEKNILEGYKKQKAYFLQQMFI